MNKQTKIIPAVLARNKSEFVSQWNKVAPFFSYIQIDVTDGQFVKTATPFKPEHISQFVKNHELEIHLMVKNVAKHLAEWTKLTQVKKIIWHYEAESDNKAIACLADFLKQQKIQTGLALNLDTPLSVLKNNISKINTVMLMGVYPGKQGQKFEEKVLSKIKNLRRLYPKINIEIDGGVNAENFQKIKNSGANLLVIGNYLQKSKNIKLDLKHLK